MSKREAITRLTLIIKKLRKQPATFEEIYQYLKFESELQEYDFTVSKRTFQRDLGAIRAIYNIDIQCNLSQQKYYIEFEDEPEKNERILEAFDIFNALNVSDRLSPHILFETRKSRGTENLNGLLHAIKNNLQIKFTYQKFWEETGTERTVEPFVLKEFKNRWYVEARDLKDREIKTFALDRLTALEITKHRFNALDFFDIELFYRNCFGIMKPGTPHEPPKKIVLSLSPFQAKYIRSMPLHESQKLVKVTEEETIISLKMHITEDFVMELLSLGRHVKALEPKSLVNRLKFEYEKALGRYEEK
ncbi:MAG TPA: WYL domain-containing protein [Crocinitomicaceae bacterium]|nr:WYL domain-containing protein [Crocinitomicaceae bacterium]